jgi:hypothetical protein
LGRIRSYGSATSSKPARSPGKGLPGTRPPRCRFQGAFFPSQLEGRSLRPVAQAPLKSEETRFSWL